MAAKKTVLITGCGGRIGQVLHMALRQQYELSGIDRDPATYFDVAVANLTDLNAILPVFQGVLGRYYAEVCGITVICIRLGTVLLDNRPGDDPRSYVSWISHRDLTHMVQRFIEVECQARLGRFYFSL